MIAAHANKGICGARKNTWGCSLGCHGLLEHAPLDSQSKKASGGNRLSRGGKKRVFRLLLGNDGVLQHEGVMRPCKYGLNEISTRQNQPRFDAAKIQAF